MHTDGVLTRRAGKPVPRPRGVITPCHKCPKIPEGLPKARQHAEEPSRRNRLALRHYRECRATGRFPDDPIVRRNAGIIRDVEDAVADARLDRIALSLELLCVGTERHR